MMNKKVSVAIALAALLGTSCTVQKPLYDWGLYDDAIYAYTKTNDEKSMEKLIALYERLIEKPKGSRAVPPPGVCADLGYLLVKSGEIKRGKELLQKETQLYPESKKFIDGVIKRLEK